MKGYNYFLSFPDWLTKCVKSICHSLTALAVYASLQVPYTQLCVLTAQHCGTVQVDMMSHMCLWKTRQCFVLVVLHALQSCRAEGIESVYVPLLQTPTCTRAYGNYRRQASSYIAIHQPFSHEPHYLTVGLKTMLLIAMLAITKHLWTVEHISCIID